MADHLEPKVPRGDDGFGIVEMMVAVLILTLVVAYTTASMISAVTVSRNVVNRVSASNVVASVLGALRVQSLTPAGFDSLRVTTQPLPSQTVGGVTYTLMQSNEWVGSGTTTSVCAAGTSSALLLRSTVTAAWSAGQSVSETTLFSPPSGAFNPSNGSVAVTLDSASGGHTAGATVTLTGSDGTSYSLVTGTDGCAFFPSLSTTTSYTVAVSGPSYVAPSESATITSPALTVDAGQVTSLPLSFDHGGTINWQYQYANGFAPGQPLPPVATGMSTSLGGASNQFGAADLYPASSGGTLFPVYPGPYDIFAGTCTDANPLGTTGGPSPTTLYSAAQQKAASDVTVVPSAATTASVPLYPLRLRIVSGSSTATATATATATTASGTATAVAGNGACVGGTPTYGLGAVIKGISATAVGLGQLAITVTATMPTKTGGTQQLSGQVAVWVQPDGVYTLNHGKAGTRIYSFAAGTGSVPVPVS